MNPLLLPPALQRGSALLIFALGGFVMMSLPVLTSLAAQRGSLAPRARALAPWLVGGYLAAWLAAALVTGDGASFPLEEPALRSLISLLVGFGPMVLAVALLFSSRSLRALNASMRPEWLVRVQAYRMAGLVFLFPYLAFGLLPAGFAVPAAVGDFLTGLAAPLVGAALARRWPGARALATAWNVFGILDLVVAPAAAVLSGAQVLSLYPLALVPLFFGPPLGILVHVWSLRNLAVTSRSAQTRPATAAGAPLGAT
jgi:hypothetical protein